jgi:hypothetical protein
LTSSPSWQKQLFEATTPFLLICTDDENHRIEGKGELKIPSTIFVAYKLTLKKTIIVALFFILSL